MQQKGETEEGEDGVFYRTSATGERGECKALLEQRPRDTKKPCFTLGPMGWIKGMDATAYGGILEAGSRAAVELIRCLSTL